MLAYAFRVEPYWLEVRTVRLTAAPSLRILHITDLHYKGDRAYLQRVVARVNATPADLLCFTGDIVEDPAFLAEALAGLSQIRKPMYGVRGNHDALDSEALAAVTACFRGSGGRWLMDEWVSVLAGRLRILGSTGRRQAIVSAPATAGGRSLLLVHDPSVVQHLHGVRFDLILAGDTYGSQVRLPGAGPLLDLPLVGTYDRGLFRTPAGLLHVNPGIGTYLVPVRFGCRPEITLIEM